MVETKQLPSVIALAGGIITSLFGLFFVSLTTLHFGLTQGDCPGLASPPLAGCTYLPYFVLYGPPPLDYLMLLQGILFELLGYLLLVLRSAYLKPRRVRVSAGTGKRRFPKAGIMLALGLSFVLIIGIALSPQTGCSMEPNTLPAPSCAYLPYSVLFVWGGWYVLGAGILLQIAGFILSLRWIGLPKTVSESLAQQCPA